MRTNTTTFRNRVFRDLRAQGVSSTKAKRIRDMICIVAGLSSYTTSFASLFKTTFQRVIAGRPSVRKAKSAATIFASGVL